MVKKKVGKAKLVIMGGADGPTIRRGSIEKIRKLGEEEPGFKWLAEKMERYIMSLGSGERDMKVKGEIERLGRKLGISVKPREYIFLSKVRKLIAEGAKVDYREVALSSGYQIEESTNPEISIMSKIDPKLMTEMLGFNRGDVEREMIKVMKQDTDLVAKMRALELAGKMIGMMGDEKGVQINFNTGIKLGD